jgi:16S rRNA (guanine1516-N2)-methyltransferase
MSALPLLIQSELYRDAANALAQQLGVTPITDCSDNTAYLLLNEDGLSIQINDMYWRPDLVGGRAGFRRQHGGGSKEPIARACGVKPNVRPSVLDGTAGWLRDAFVLAAVGCKVTAIERHPIVYALMQNALVRANRHSETAALLTHLHYQHADTQMVLAQLAGAPEHDVIYLDPMFPPREKSAQVKKDMQVLQYLAETDLGDALLAPALKAAKKRVVVKRPDYAPPLANIKPNNVLESGANRFDIYMMS